jgi:Fe-S-cluster containining protein
MKLLIIKQMMIKMNKPIYPKNLLITRFSPVREMLELGKKCDKSGHCCSYGGGYVLQSEINDFAKNLNITKEELIENYLDEKISFNTKHYKLKSKITNKPFGPCVFLGDDKLCTIHEIKPLHCKVGSCCHNSGEQLSLWFALNHFVNPNDAESIRQWALHLKSNPTIPGGELNELVPDKERLKKILNYEEL